MKVLTLPRESKLTVIACVMAQGFAFYTVATRIHRSFVFSVAAFFIGGFLTDLISGLAHFSFDYIWPPRTPVLGPIAVEFQEHHRDPTLDPSAVWTNLTKAAYAALPIAVITWIVAASSADTAIAFLVSATLMSTSLWMLGFHQIHSYAHMGSRLSPEDFNRAVAEISCLPDSGQQRKEFARLFDNLGIPRFVRILQRCRLFLRPEVHWRHHNSFESDFSSVNGWSDPFMNWLYRPLARRKIAQLSVTPVSKVVSTTSKH